MRHLRGQRASRLLRAPVYQSGASQSFSGHVLRSPDKLKVRAKDRQAQLVRRCVRVSAEGRIQRARVRLECVRRLEQEPARVLHLRHPLDVPWAVLRVQGSVIYRVA